MSSTRIPKRLAVAAAAIGAAGSLMIAAPANAMPPLPLVPSKDCDWQLFATDSNLDQGNGTVVHIAWGSGGGGDRVLRFARHVLGRTRHGKSAREGDQRVGLLRPIPSHPSKFRQSPRRTAH